MTQDGDIVMPLLIFLRRKGAAQLGVCLQEGEEFARNGSCVNPLWRPRSRKIVVRAFANRQLLKHVVLTLPVQIVCRRNRKSLYSGELALRRTLGDLHQLIRMSEWQRS